MDVSTIHQCVKKFVPHDQSTQDFKETLLTFLLEHSSDFWQRTSFNPGHITASAWVVNPARTHALLIFHKGAHAWFQPGGHIESSDASIIDAVLREVKEETGLDGKLIQEEIFDIDIHRIATRPEKHEPEHIHFDIRFLIEVPHLVRDISDSGIGGLQWFSRVDIEEMHTTESVLRMAHVLNHLV